jgi:hypothetical protein
LRSLPGGHGFKLLALPFFLIATFGVGLLGENIGLLGCALALNTGEDEDPLGENIGLLGCALANEDPDDDDDGEDDPIACACCKVSAGICIIRTGLLSATIV